MGKYFWTLGWLVSLSSFVLALYLPFRTTKHGDVFGMAYHESSFEVWTMPSRLLFAIAQPRPKDFPSWYHCQFDTAMDFYPQGIPESRWWGMVVARHVDKHDPYWAYIDLWLVILSTAMMPCLELWRKLRRKVRSRRGQCLACGYDLRATPLMCPECGFASLSASGNREIC
jgi:hypothetical protein